MPAASTAQRGLTQALGAKRDIMGWPLICTLVALTLLNAGASIQVAKNHAASATQRTAQMALIWLVPVVGAVVCLIFLRTDSLSSAALEPVSLGGGVDPGGGEWDVPTGASICGCDDGGSGGGADGSGD